MIVAKMEETGLVDDSRRRHDGDDNTSDADRDCSDARSSHRQQRMKRSRNGVVPLTSNEETGPGGPAVPGEDNHPSEVTDHLVVLCILHLVTDDPHECQMHESVHQVGDDRDKHDQVAQIA